ILLLCVAWSQSPYHSTSNRFFIKPFEPTTLDVFLEEEYFLFVDGLESSTEYMVKLSYPGVIPVQYDVFMEHDTPDKPTEYSVHKRRIQDTRILRFQTDRYTQVWAYDEEEKPTIKCHPIIHIIPHHLAIAKTPDQSKERFVTIIVEPLLFGATPTIWKETWVIGVSVFLLLLLLHLYHTNHRFANFVNRFFCVDE
ncbi:hypothetical protein WA588_005839, partial [Blastocystis sp. NMH]